MNKAKVSVTEMVFKKNLKFNLARVINEVINNIVSPYVLVGLSSEEMEEFSDTIMKVADEALLEISAQNKQRAKEMIENYKRNEKIRKEQNNSVN